MRGHATQPNQDQPWQRGGGRQGDVTVIARHGQAHDQLHAGQPEHDRRDGFVPGQLFGRDIGGGKAQGEAPEDAGAHQQSVRGPLLGQAAAAFRIKGINNNGCQQNRDNTQNDQRYLDNTVGDPVDFLAYVLDVNSGSDNPAPGCKTFNIRYFRNNPGLIILPLPLVLDIAGPEPDELG